MITLTLKVPEEHKPRKATPFELLPYKDPTKVVYGRVAKFISKYAEAEAQGTAENAVTAVLEGK